MSIQITDTNVRSDYTRTISKFVNAMDRVGEAIRKTEIEFLQHLLHPLESMKAAYRSILTKYLELEQDDTNSESRGEEASETDHDGFECVLQPQYEQTEIYKLFELGSRSSMMEPTRKRHQ